LRGKGVNSFFAAAPDALQPSVCRIDGDRDDNAAGNHGEEGV